ncbi:MAG: ATP-binding protein [Spartobacteria bacterium]|nr:ATP-binding protein [Spartobacteria bacterium]
MLERLQEIILDYQEMTLDPGIARRMRVKSVRGKATVCIGVRRCGKSTYMFQHMLRLLDEGVPRENLLYINFFDDRLHGLQHDRLGLISEAYFLLYPEKKNTEKIYCFFDEIQVFSGWEAFVERLMRTENCEMFITGSSAHMLSRELATQMRGRAVSWELFPFSFREFLDFKGVNSVQPFSTKQRLVVSKLFDEFLESGGFPEVAGVEKLLRIRLHQEYFNAMLFRDLIERYDISHPRAVMDLAHWLTDNIASLYTVNRLTGFLKSLSYHAPKSAVSDYLSWFEDAFIFFTVRVFDASVARSNTNPKKVYCIDHSMISSISSGILVNAGHLLENLVFTALRRVTKNIFYYKTKAGREVDFIAQQERGKRMLVQVCESLADPKTRKREIAALEDAMTELGVRESVVVTRHESEQIHVECGTVHVVPAWSFLLSLDEL